MNMLASLSTESDIADEKDSVGGGFTVLDTAIYAMSVTLAYLTKSKGEALGMVLNLKAEDGRELKQTLWMTSGKEKGCKNFYTDKAGEKKYLPGFIQANALCLLTVGKEISAMETEQKVVNVYSSEAKAEVPTKVDVLVDLLGKDILVGVIKQTVDKTRKNEATGQYDPTGETRDENEIDKLFRARDRMTTAEIRAQSTQAIFADTWESKWAGKTKDKTKKAGGTAGVPKGTAAAFAGAQAAAAAKKPATSLFG